MVSESSIVQLAEKTFSEHKKEIEVTAGVIAAGALLYATRGKIADIAENIAPLRRFLPELTLTAESAAESAPKAAEAANGLLTATREQTFAERATEKTARMSVDTAKLIIKKMRTYDAPKAVDATLGPSDEVRRHVFNRFLARVGQGGDYVLHGSYALENQIASGARKAVNDLDLLSTNPKLAEGTTAEISKSLQADLQRLAGKDLGDGLSFKVSVVPERTVNSIVYPRMRHLLATAEADGKEVMSIPLDLRVGAKTILPPEQLSLANRFDGTDYSTAIPTMRKEETLAYKLYTYGNRYFGGVARKPKDLKDIATMIKSGANPDDTAEALQAWTSRGYSMAPLRPVQDILGPKNPLPSTAAEEMSDNFRTLKSFYQGISDKVENVSTGSDVSTNWLSRSAKFMKKHFIVYPVELK
jgi:Nucleotidyl transferase AbiEii toxin, Type IV TA system